mgnify:CR=1 FL=1
MVVVFLVFGALVSRIPYYCRIFYQTFNKQQFSKFSTLIEFRSPLSQAPSKSLFQAPSQALSQSLLQALSHSLLQALSQDLYKALFHSLFQVLFLISSSLSSSLSSSHSNFLSCSLGLSRTLKSQEHVEG